MFLLIVFRDYDNTIPYFFGVFKNVKNLVAFSDGYIKHCDLYPKNKVRKNKSIKKLFQIHKLPKNIK